MGEFAPPFYYLPFTFILMNTIRKAVCYILVIIFVTCGIGSLVFLAENLPILNLMQIIVVFIVSAIFFIASYFMEVCRKEIQ